MSGSLLQEVAEELNAGCRRQGQALASAVARAGETLYAALDASVCCPSRGGPCDVECPSCCQSVLAVHEVQELRYVYDDWEARAGRQTPGSRTKSLDGAAPQAAAPASRRRASYDLRDRKERQMRGAKVAQEVGLPDTAVQHLVMRQR